MKPKLPGVAAFWFGLVLCVASTLCPAQTATTRPAMSKSEIEALISRLADANETVRNAAREELIGRGDDARAAVEAQLKARGAAENALSEIDAKRAGDPTLVSRSNSRTSPRSTRSTSWRRRRASPWIPTTSPPGSRATPLTSR